MEAWIATKAVWQRDGAWRRLMWGALALVLIAPAVAMRFTGEVRWSGRDFAAAALLLAVTGAATELVVRRAPPGLLRMALLVAVATGAILVWAEGAVGILD